MNECRWFVFNPSPLKKMLHSGRISCFDLRVVSGLVKAITLKAIKGSSLKGFIKARARHWLDGETGFSDDAFRGWMNAVFQENPQRSYEINVDDVIEHIPSFFSNDMKKEREMVMQSVDYVIMQSGATGNARFIIDGGFDSDTGIGEFRVSDLMKETFLMKEAFSYRDSAVNVIRVYRDSSAVNEAMDCIIHWIEVEKTRFPLKLEERLGHTVSDYVLRESEECLDKMYGYRFKKEWSFLRTI